MKRLILMRHAKSDWSDGAQTDHDRSLNRRGKRDAPALGKWLRQQGLVVDTVMCSSAMRTRETLELLALKNSPKIEFTRALYLATADEILKVLQGAEGETVLVIGHNPGIAHLAGQIVTNTADLEGMRQCPTGATMVATFDVNSWMDVTWHSGNVTHVMIPRELPDGD